MGATDRREGASERSEEMVDTVKLYLKSNEFFVEDNAKLFVVPPDIDNSTGITHHGFKLFENGKGIHKGRRAYYNNRANGLRVTIKPDPYRQGPLQETYCYLEFSIPRIINGDNFYPAEKGEVYQAFEFVFEELESIGLIGDFIKTRFSRIDFFKNVEVEFPVQSYYPIFETLRGKRMRNNEGINGEYHRWDNKEHAYCCYDKNAERLDKRLPVVQGNIIRCEYRLLKHSKIKTVLGYETVEDLLNNYENVRLCYHAAFSDLLRYEPNELELILAEEQIKNILLTYKEMGKSQWLRDSFQYIGLRELLIKFGVDTLKNIVNEVAGNRMSGSRVSAKIDEMNRQMLMANIEAKSQKTYAKLYKEFKEKVLDGKVSCCKSA